ncbi:MAG: PVC-type heme-binding CxxCH protein [Planctomycetota bacterium]|jgi:putative membrane-bound dehydrogenase-like protein
MRIGLKKHVVVAVMVGWACVAGAQDAQRDPSKAVSGLDVADGLEAQLFASEPMVRNLTNIDVDHRGRAWVCEVVNYRFFRNKDAEPRAAGDRILILEDTDGDGAADSSKVFYQGPDVDSAMGICVLGNRVFVSATPYILILTDTDGDDRADKKEYLFTGMEGKDHDHAVHSVVFGPDGRLYFNFGNNGKKVLDRDGKPIVDKAGNVVDASRNPYQEGMVFRCDPDGSNFETLGWNFRNNYEAAVDSFGTIWQSDNDDDGNRGVRINFVMEFGNYGYKDELTGAGWREYRVGQHPDVPQRHFHQNDPGVVPNMLQTYAGSPTGITVYEGRLLPEVFHDQVIHCDAGPNVVRAYPAIKDGAGYKAEVVNILKGARDPWFRPADVTVAPDGSLFVTDWYDPGVGGHKMGDNERGRVFRVAPPGVRYTVPEHDFSTPDGAVTALKSPSPATRYLAWEALRQMGDGAENALRAMSMSDNPRFRARALWLLVRLKDRAGYYLNAAFLDRDENIRIVGLRAARQLGVGVLAFAQRLSRDPSPAVRREVAIALRGLRAPNAHALWAQLAARHTGQDRWYLEALGLSADGNWDARFAAWRGMVGDNWNTTAGRDIVWRSRATAALPLLGKLIDELDPSDDRRLRYFRAFDFHPNSKTKNDVLGRLVMRGDATAHQAMLQIDPASVRADEKLLIQVSQLIDELKGTPDYVKLLGRFGVEVDAEELLRMALAQPNQTLGVDAGRLLMRSGNAGILIAALNDPDNRRAVPAAAVLGHLGNPRAVELLGATVENTGRSRQVRAESVKGLSRSERGEDLLKEIVVGGRLPSDLTVTASTVMRSSRRMSVRDTAAEHLAVVTGRDAQPLPPVSELVKRRGNRGDGQKVFATSCVACHVVDGEGIDFGPGLSDIGNKLSREAMYVSILDPSGGINFDYEGWIVNTKDGSVIVGIVISETETDLRIKQVGGVEVGVSIGDIAQREKMPISLMTEGLHQAMTTQELVDLVEYLMSLKVNQK